MDPSRTVFGDRIGSGSFHSQDRTTGVCTFTPTDIQLIPDPALGSLRAWSAIVPKSKMKDTMKTLDQQLDYLIPVWTSLLKELKGHIGDDYRATDDPDDNTPGMCVTIGFTPESEDKDMSWSYQTGDNSYSGGAYSHAHWAVIYLYRRSKSRELATDAASQLGELIAQ